LDFIKVEIILSREKVDAQECDVLVAGFFSDERPLKGSSGWIDWRFNGMLSQLLKEKKLTGDWREATLIPSQERILPRMILLLGLGEVKSYGYPRLRKLSSYLLDTLRKLGWLKICLSFPCGESYHLDCRKLVESLIEGIADGLEQQGPFSEEGWIRRLRLYFAEGEEVFPEMLSGAQTAKSIFRKRMQLEISVSSEANST
jgi:Cytosol aminopeptidase family, N-terminal domain